MADKSNENKNEKLFDALVKAALEEAAEQESSSYPSKEELDKMYPRSADFDKRIMRLIAKEERAYKRKRSMRVFTRIAASIAVLFVVGVSTVFFWNIASSPGVPDAQAEVHSYVLPRVAFDAATDELSDNFIEAEFTDDEFFDLEYNWGGWDFYVREFVIDINGQEINIFEATWDGGYHAITWEQEDVHFHISSNADIDELIAMVENFLESER